MCVTIIYFLLIKLIMFFSSIILFIAIAASYGE